MTINSYNFILYFLPVFFALYFIFSRFGIIYSKGIIILAGIVFYAFSGVDNFIVLCISIVMNLCMIILIRKAENPKGKDFFLITAIILNVLLLIRCKYFKFIIDTINVFAAKEIKYPYLIFPLGISFFTFHQIMYVVSFRNGKISDLNLLDYLSYILYFPKINMGPLMEPADFINQVNDQTKKKINYLNLASGLKLFSLGLFKKMVLADTFAKAVDGAFANDISGLTSCDLFLTMLFYTFQIFFDFSGYSDMATGISKMINILLPINFDSPYKAFSIKSFWSRWHISLTAFFTNYIYIPLGGNRKGSLRTYINIMTVYLISGIWHGANWTFILWGCIHGFLQILERLFNRVISKIPRLIRWGCTFVIINLLWLLFRAESIGQWWNMITKMFGFQNLSVSRELYNSFVLPEQTFIFDKLGLIQADQKIQGFPMIIFIAAAFFICLVPECSYKRSEKLNWFNMAACAVLFVWGFLCLSSESVFVYLNF